MPSLPGMQTRRTYTPRDIMWTHEGMIENPGGVVIASSGWDGSQTGYEYEIRAGWLLGKITASGLYVPCKRTRVNMTGATATDITVDDASPFKAGDVITIGGDTGLTISAVNYTTNVITIASTTVADNDVVFAEDGSGTCVTISLDFAKLKTDDNLLAAPKSVRNLLAGVVNADMVLGDLAAILAHADSAANLAPIKFYTP